MGSSAEKIVADPVHGGIGLNSKELKVIDTQSFQRLRRLKQLGLGHLTYPNATHTRFAHSLGALQIMKLLIDATQETISLNPQEQEDLKLAALLHDIGHYPYSHLVERLEEVQFLEEWSATRAKKSREISVAAPYPNHEELGALIVKSQKDILDAIGDRDQANRIVDLFTKKEINPQLSKLIHSSLDIDRIDYLLRDARATGTPYGLVDIEYLLTAIAISDRHVIGFKKKAQSALEHFLLARYFMYRTVYFHKTTFGFEEACRHLLRRCRDRGGYNIPKDGNEVRGLVEGEGLRAFADGWVDHIVQKASDDADKTIQSLAKCILTRRPPRLLYEASELTDVKPVGRVTNACTEFRRLCRMEAPKLTKKYKLPPGLFLYAEPGAIKLEFRGPFIPATEASRLSDEPDDETIRVFDGQNPEPQSLVTFRDSLMYHLGGKALYLARLYVICEDSTKVEAMKKEVRAWLD